MHIIEDNMMVKLPENTECSTYKAGESYEIKAHEKFRVKVPE